MKGWTQHKPFSATINPPWKKFMREATKRDGFVYGLFFDVSGKLRLERINPTAQYQYIWRSDS